jgi:hypothetical protein
MTKSSYLSGLNRRHFLRAGMLSGAAVVAAPLAGQRPPRPASTGPVPPFEFDEVTIAALQEGMKSG